METINKELIEEMLAKAEKTAEPGELAKNPIVSSGDETMPPMVATKIKSAGYVYIYNTVTGEQSLTNRNMLPFQLKKTRADGSSVFTTVRPQIIPYRGTMKCLLHPDNPDRSHYDDLGLAVCLKSNLTNEYQVRRHAQKRHRDEWSVIEAEIKEQEKMEERTERRQFYKALGGKAANPAPLPIVDTAHDNWEATSEDEDRPLYVSDKPPKPKKKRKYVRHPQ